MWAWHIWVNHIIFWKEDDTFGLYYCTWIKFMMRKSSSKESPLWNKWRMKISLVLATSFQQNRFFLSQPTILRPPSSFQVVYRSWNSIILSFVTPSLTVYPCRPLFNYSSKAHCIQDTNHQSMLPWFSLVMRVSIPGKCLVISKENKPLAGYWPWARDSTTLNLILPFSNGK